MSITETRDGRFQVRIVRKDIGFDTKKVVATRSEAERVEQLILADLATGVGGEAIKTDGITLREACDLTYQLVWKNRKDGKGLHRRGEMLVEFFGSDRQLYTVTSIDATAYQDHLAIQGLSNSTINRRLSPLSVMWKVAASQDRVRWSDKPVVLSKTEPEGRLRWLFPDEERHLVDFFTVSGKANLADWLKFSIDTGLRTGESLHIMSSHIDREYNLTVASIKDDDGTVDWFTKNAKSRTLPLTTRAREIAERRSHQQLLFGDVPYSQLTHWFSKAQRIVFGGDTSVTPYVTRHTCASRLVQAGMELPKIKKWMGHSSISVTERYAKMSSRDIIEGVDMLEGFTADNKSDSVPLTPVVN